MQIPLAVLLPSSRRADDENLQSEVLGREMQMRWRGTEEGGSVAHVHQERRRCRPEIVERKISIMFSRPLETSFQFLLWISMKVLRLWREIYTAALSEARATLPESSSRPLPAKTAHSRNFAYAALETAVVN